MKSLLRSGIAAAALLVLASMQAPAQVTFQLGNNPQPNEENVLLNTGLTGTTIVGTTNQSNTSVDFTSTETLTAPSNGQARVEGVDGVVGPEPLTISLTNGDIFGDLIFNPFIGGNNAPSDNDVTVTANTTAGSLSFTYTMSNGQNFLSLFADVGVGINSVVIDPVVGFTDLRQIRISGIGEGGGGPPAEVPEPGTWAMLAGFGVPAIGLIRRVRRS